jgi:hypothetical protein
MVTIFEAFLAGFGAEPTLAGSRLPGRSRGGRENLPGAEGGRSWTAYVLTATSDLVPSGLVIFDMLADDHVLS